MVSTKTLLLKHDYRCQGVGPEMAFLLRELFCLKWGSYQASQQFIRNQSASQTSLNDDEPSSGVKYVSLAHTLETSTVCTTSIRNDLWQAWCIQKYICKTGLLMQWPFGNLDTILTETITSKKKKIQD